MMNLTRGAVLVEDGTKTLYATDEMNLAIQFFQDRRVAERWMQLCEWAESHNIPTVYLERLNDRELLVKRVAPLGTLSPAEGRMLQERSRALTAMTPTDCATFGRYGGELLLADVS